MTPCMLNSEIKLLQSAIQFLESHLFQCQIKANFGFDCPSCGLQRSIIYLLKGDIWASLQIFPSIFPFLFIWMLLPIHLIFKLKYGAFFIKNLAIISGVIMFIHFIYKILKYL